MTNSAINNTAHTQRQPNRQSRKRKRKHFAEITGSPKPSKNVLVDAASSKRRQLYPLIPTPPSTEELTPRKAAGTISNGEHYNYDHIWDLIRERKAREYSSNMCPATMDTRDDATTITGITTATQARKEQTKFAEQVLHPRWITIERDVDCFANRLSEIQKIVQKALYGDSESIQQSPDIRSIIGDELFASIDEGHGVLMKKLRYLRKSQASEPQWEARLWRRWFFKDSIQDPDDLSISKPFMGQVVQAKMTLSSGGAVLPPLLASADARRESGRVVAPVPWNPNLEKQKGNHILRYPDYLYAVSESSLQLRKHDFHVDELPAFRYDQLPAFRLAQYKYLPANWIAEIKLENTEANHLAAEHYCAFLSAYLLHERLLLHWIAKNESIKSNNPVEFDDNLAVYCITCCGPECRIWRMSIRKKEASSDLEPVRYDMQLLETLDLEDNGGQRLCDWINALNALALTVQFNGIIADLKGIGIQANESRLSPANESRLPPATPHTYSWTSKVGFVYKAGSTTQICIAPLGELRKAYNNGRIKADQRIGDKVILEWDEKGQPIEVDITQKGDQVPEPIASSVLPSAPSAGNAWMTQFAEAELRRLRPSVVERIAQVLSDHINSREDIGSTREGHMEYITRAQQVLAANGMRMDFSGIWKRIRLSKGDLSKLRVDTLRTICNSIGVRNLGPTATKVVLVEALEPLLTT